MRPITPEVLREALTLPAPFPPPSTDAVAPAAVLVPVRCGDVARVIVVARSEHLAEHAGEIGFPGGKPEPGDASLEAAALREAEEEVGIRAEQLELLGPLTPVPVVTGRYLIHPYVGVLSRDAAVEATSSEVAAVLSVPLDDYLSGKRVEAVMTKWRGRDFPLPHFRLGERVLYGASAVVFAELLVRVSTVLGVTLPEPELVTEFPWQDRYGS